MASFASLVRGGHAKTVNLGARKPKTKTTPAVGYGGTSGKYEHTLGEAGPGQVADTKTVAERGGGLGGPATSQPPAIDVKTAAERGGGLGGPASYQPPPIDTQTAAQRGGGLGGTRTKRTR